MVNSSGLFEGDSSTLSTVRTKEKDENELPCQHKKSRKNKNNSNKSSNTVRFNEGINQVISVIIDESDEKTRWYTSKEYEAIQKRRQTHLAQSRTWIRHDSTGLFLDTLQNMHEICSRVDFVMDDADLLWRDRFAQLYTAPPMGWVLGLESHLFRNHDKYLMEQRQDCLQQVVQDIQTEYKEFGMWRSHEDAFANELRESCRTYSQPAVLLAQLLARASWVGTDPEEQEYCYQGHATRSAATSAIPTTATTKTSCTSMPFTSCSSASITTTGWKEPCLYIRNDHAGNYTNDSRMV